MDVMECQPNREDQADLMRTKNSPPKHGSEFAGTVRQSGTPALLASHDGGSGGCRNFVRRR
eukprot:95231-Heterocapsa_arctica.AAC.1